MQTDVAEIIFERVKVLPIEKQREILHQIEIVEKEESTSIWKKIRAKLDFSNGLFQQSNLLNLHTKFHIRFATD